jgi:hypothetical protein
LVEIKKTFDIARNALADIFKGRTSIVFFTVLLSLYLVQNDSPAVVIHKKQIGKIICTAYL